jgi:hypothetical protein
MVANLSLPLSVLNASISFIDESGAAFPHYARSDTHGSIFATIART